MDKSTMRLDRRPSVACSGTVIERVGKGNNRRLESFSSRLVRKGSFDPGAMLADPKNRHCIEM